MEKGREVGDTGGRGIWELLQGRGGNGNGKKGKGWGIRGVGG
jgi:hypothetical protein